MWVTSAQGVCVVWAPCFLAGLFSCLRFDLLHFPLSFLRKQLFAKFCPFSSYIKEEPWFLGWAYSTLATPQKPETGLQDWATQRCWLLFVFAHRDQCGWQMGPIPQEWKPSPLYHWYLAGLGSPALSSSSLSLFDWLHLGRGSELFLFFLQSLGGTQLDDVIQEIRPVRDVWPLPFSKLRSASWALSLMVVNHQPLSLLLLANWHPRQHLSCSLVQQHWTRSLPCRLPFPALPSSTATLGLWALPVSC